MHLLRYYMIRQGNILGFKGEEVLCYLFACCEGYLRHIDFAFSLKSVTSSYDLLSRDLKFERPKNFKAGALQPTTVVIRLKSLDITVNYANSKIY